MRSLRYVMSDVYCEVVHIAMCNVDGGNVLISHSY